MVSYHAADPQIHVTPGGEPKVQFKHTGEPKVTIRQMSADETRQAAQQEGQNDADKKSGAEQRR